MRLNAFIWTTAAGAILGSGLGCSSGSGALPTLIPVKGKVTYKGQPLTKGEIKFEPDGYGRKARGQLQADGTFELTTDKQADGVVAGHHQVSISGTGSRFGQEIVPKKYTQRNSSKLEVDVDAEHTEFSFDLK